MTLTLFKLRQQNFVTTVNAKIVLVVANHALCEDSDSGSKPRTLKSLPKTRWSARKDVSALLVNFGNVVESLALLTDDVKQADDLQKQLDWTFLLMLAW